MPALAAFVIAPTTPAASLAEMSAEPGLQSGSPSVTSRTIRCPPGGRADRYAAATSTAPRIGELPPSRRSPLLLVRWLSRLLICGVLNRAVGMSMPPASHASAAAVNDFRPQLMLSVYETALPTARMAIDHLDAVPQPLVQDPSGVAFIEVDASRTIRMSGGSGCAIVIRAPQFMPVAPPAPVLAAPAPPTPTI